MLPVPAEVEIFGTYFPPLLLAATLGALAMVVTVSVLNRYRLSRYFYLPEVVMLSLTAIYTIIIGMFVIPI
ncbi:MAG: DUF1656 domain-containing protein, partial [Pseudomonadota bacterium]|nr:DUF1656 domain-containing protein [Pseudomonadota bacterium]